MRWLLPLALALGGCLSDHARMLASWEGVYAVEGYRVDPDGCDAPLDATPDAPWVQLVAEPGTQSDLVDLRWCEAPDDCERVGFFTFVVPRASTTSLDGARDEVFYAAPGLQEGICQVVHEAVSVSRADAEAASIAVEIRSGSASDPAAVSDDACLELLAALASDPEGCDALRAFEARRDEP